jgi:DnaJ-class molecular chaperone
MKNYYLILQLEPDASPEEIRKAYRRLARLHHPDCEGGDARRFLEIRDAYETLADPARRREYNESIKAAGPPTGSILEDGPVDLELDFASHAPSFDTLLETFFRRFTGMVGKAGQREHLSVEIILSQAEAARGGVLPLEVPFYVECPRCEGTGREIMIMCARCEGRGAVAARRSFPVTIPSGVRDRTTFDFDLDDIGLEDTVLHVIIRVR